MLLLTSIDYKHPNFTYEGVMETEVWMVVDFNVKDPITYRIINETR